MKRAIVMVWILALVAAPAFAQKKKDKDKGVNLEESLEIPNNPCSM